MIHHKRYSRISSSARLRLLLSSFVIVLCCGASATASAEDESDTEDTTSTCQTYSATQDRANAREVIRKGLDCFEVGRYDWALTHYRAAFSLVPDPFLFGGIGRSLQELGAYEPAMGYYRAFLNQDDIPSGADRIRQRVAELEELLEEDAGTVSLRSAPSGTDVYLVLENGEWYSLGETPVEVRLRPGEYEFAFDDEDFRPHQVRTGVQSNETNQVNAELISEQATVSVADRTRRRAGIATIGAAVPVTAAGVTLLALSLQNTSAAQTLENDFEDLSDFDRRRQEHLDSASTYRLWGTITTAVGVTGLITGTVIYLTGRNNDTKTGDDSSATSITPAESVRIEPILGLNHLGLRLRF